MTLTRRGRWTAAVSVVVVAGTAALAYLVLSGKAPALIQRAAARIGIAEPPPPPTCPLTGEPAPAGAIPDRPVLAIKVENIPEARPQAGLESADIIYEEPVEGGITRFIAVFHCHDSERVGPVRSGRSTDPQVLVQFGRAVIGYAGGVNAVKRAVGEAGLIDVNYIIAAGAYERDPSRSPPHDLYTTTRALYRAAGSQDGAPEGVFAYADELSIKSRRARSVHLPFSTSSDVYWRWGGRKGAWLRFDGGEPHLLEGGLQVAAANVVVQLVQVTAGSVLDAAGNPSPELKLTGSGRAYIFIHGRVIVGKWLRPSLDDITTLVTKDGEEIPLAPGVTWVELLDRDIEVEIEAR